MSREELTELHTLYRRTTSDLAYAQSNVGDEEVLNLLNDLVASAHAAIYAPERPPIRDITRSLLLAAPAALRRRLRYVGLAASVLVGAALAGGVLVGTDSTWLDTLLPSPLRASVEVWKTGRFPDTRGTEQFGFMAGLNLNNSIVALLVAGSGFSFGIVTTWLLALNGAVLGSVIVEVARSGQLIHLLSGIGPHGVPEIAAILIAGGVGFVIAGALLRPGDRPRADVLREAGPDCFWMLIVSLALLLAAALLEAYVSHSVLPKGAKFAIALLGLAALAAFVLGVRSHGSDTAGPAAGPGT